MTDERLAVLETRLENGFRKIGEAMAQGVAAENWERFWVELLREYEALADELAAPDGIEPVAQAAMDLGRVEVVGAIPS